MLESSRLWRQVAIEVAKDYPDVTLEHMLVDACSMRHDPEPEILRCAGHGKYLRGYPDRRSLDAGRVDGHAALGQPGGSAAGGVRIFGLYEPIHGSAPRHAGQNEVNPIATILSAAMMLRYSFALEKEAQAVEKAVDDV